MLNILRELQKTWGYTIEEMNDIEFILEEYGNSCYLQGLEDGAKSMDFSKEDYGYAYGKKEDY